MVATQNRKKPARIREGPLLNVFNPGPVNPNWNVVFRFAGYRTRMATYAFAVVNDEAVTHGGESG